MSRYRLFSSRHVCRRRAERHDSKHVFSTRAHSALLTAAAQERNYFFSLKNVSANIKRTHTLGGMDLVTADGYKVCSERGRSKRNSHKALYRIAVRKCVGITALYQAKGFCNSVECPRLVVYKHKACHKYLFIKARLERVNVKHAAHGRYFYDLKAVLFQDLKRTLCCRMLGVGSEYPRCISARLGIRRTKYRKRGRLSSARGEYHRSLPTSYAKRRRYLLSCP